MIGSSRTVDATTCPAAVANGAILIRLNRRPKNSGKGIGDSGGKAGELGKHAATQTAQGVWTNHHRGADETHDNAGALLGR
jgi:hypothetical protein